MSLSPVELEKADEYEGPAYIRTICHVESGKEVWVYTAAPGKYRPGDSQ